MQKLFVLVAVLVSFTGTIFSQPPAGYYDAAVGLQGENLRLALHKIIKNHTVIPYNIVHYYFSQTDKNFEGYVWDMYSDIPTTRPPYVFSFGDICGVYNAEGDCYAIGHAWPLDFMNPLTVAKSDLFHLYPQDGFVNNKRNNLPFGAVEAANWSSLNHSQIGICNSQYYTKEVFEPIDTYKGDYARSIFYVACRYFTEDDGWGISEMSDGSYLKPWVINMLLNWHLQDPVSTKEVVRNNNIYDIQHNRNPFIDHPEYVQYIWGDLSPVMFFVSSPIRNVYSGNFYEYKIKVLANDYTGLIIKCLQMPTWLTFSYLGNGEAILTGTPGVGEIGLHDIRLEAITDNGNISQTFEINVIQPSISIILSQDFNACSLVNWATYSVASNRNWTCSNGSMSMNGANADAASEDWLISPVIDFQNYNFEKLSFTTWNEYTDADFPQLTLFYSTDYIAGQSPTIATWTELPFQLPEPNSSTWISSGSISLAGFNEKTTFAFRYVSSGFITGEFTRWKVDNFLVEGYVGIEELKNEISEINIFPNPTDNILNIKFSLQKETDLTMDIFSITGEKMISLGTENFSAGKTQKTIEIEQLRAGLYFLRISNSSSSEYFRFVVTN